MEKFIFFVFSIFSLTTLFSQCPPGNNNPVCRGVLAGLIFNYVYEDDPNPYNYASHEFPNPYIDLQESNELYEKLKVLSYLTFGDGVPVFNYSYEPTYCFKPFSDLTKIEALIIVMEAWNIQPDYNGNSPYNDIDENDYIFGYVNKAYDEGIISGGSNFNPYEIFTQGETVQLINEVLDSSYHPVNEDLYSLDNYFVPGIYFPDNLTTSRSVNQGVLNHYAKNSFVIPDIKFSLNFSHFYSTTMVEMPQSFYPVKPLGRGWSHTYNSYITYESNVGEESIDYYFITWPDGNVDIYDEDDEEYVSKGVYDEFYEQSNGNIQITKKDQTRYYYEQIDNDLDVWYLVEIRDTNNNKIIIDYETAEADDYERIQYVEAPSGKKLTFEYLNGTDLIEKIEDPIGRDIYFEYSGVTGGWVHRYPVLTVFEDAKFQSTIYNYDISSPYNIHLLNRIDLPRGNTITAEYDNNGKLSEYRINNDDPIHINVDFDYNNNQEIVDITTPVEGGNDFDETFEFNLNGLITNYTSDTDDLEIDYPNSGVNIMLPTDTNLNGVEIEWEYDNDGNVIEINKENGDVVEYFDYDSDNNLIEYTDPNGNITEFSYDGDENLIEIQDALGNYITFDYDNDGLLISRTNQEGITVTYTYEDDGAVSSISMPEGIESNFTYDGVNRLLTKDENGLASSYSYDPNDNLTSFTNSGGFVTGYDYDENDNLISITNANNIATTFEYDDEDRVIEEKFGNLIKEYEYGDEGYLEKYTKPSGAQIEYDYDSKGRLEETGTITDFDYNNNNLVESVANSDSRYNFDYDNLNRLEEVEDEFNNNALIQYQYDDVGNIKKIIYPDFEMDFEVRYYYDDKNRLERVRVVKNSDSWDIAEYTYRDDDLLSTINYFNGISAIYIYDSAGRKKGIEYLREISGGGNVLIFSNILFLDERNNVSSEYRFYLEEESNSSPNSSIIENYSYDNNNHITTFSGNTMNVDDDGNTIEKNYEYIDPGATGGNILYQYDIDDRLTNVSADHSIFGYPTNYLYDPYGNRIEKIQSGFTTGYIWDLINNNAILEYDDNGSVQNRYYIYGGTGLEAVITPQGSGQSGIIFIGDIRGSVVAVIGDNGELINGFNKYDDFGNLIEGVYGGPLDNFKYLGKYGILMEQKQLGHYNVKARHYDAQLGRFITEDPIWSTNLYPYSSNNPISKIDPSGKTPINPLSIPIDYSVYLAKNNVDYLEQYLIDDYLVSGKFSLSIQFQLAVNEIWANNFSRNALLLPLTRGRGFSSFAGKSTTKMIGKTGYFKILDMRTKDGRLLKDFMEFLYSESESAFIKKLIYNYK